MIVNSDFLTDVILADIEQMAERMERAYLLKGYKPDYGLIAELTKDMLEVSIGQLGTTLELKDTQ